MPRKQETPKKIPFNQVTEKQIKAIYDTCPTVNELWSWEEVKSMTTLKIMLQHQASNEPLTTATAQEKCGLNPISKFVDHIEAQALKSKKTYVIGKAQAAQIRAALRMARTCINTGMGELMTRETLVEIYNAQTIFDKQDRQHIDQSRSNQDAG